MFRGWRAFITVHVRRGLPAVLKSSNSTSAVQAVRVFYMKSKHGVIQFRQDNRYSCRCVTLISMSFGYHTIFNALRGYSISIRI